jgi:hypothetical protein
MNWFRLPTARMPSACASFVLILSAASLGQQTTQQPEKLVRLLRADFEASSTYPDDPIAQVSLPCSASSWSVTADWGDGTIPEALSHPGAADQRASTRPGEYPLYSTHGYARRGQYDASFKVVMSCLGKSSQVTGQDSYRVEVFDHVPLKECTCESTTIKPGTAVLLNLKLVTAAPKSGTRVIFRTSEAPGVFQPEGLPSVVTIPPNSDRATLRIPTLKTAPAGTVTVTVIAVNGPCRQQIKIQ